MAESRGAGLRVAGPEGAASDDAEAAELGLAGAESDAAGPDVVPGGMVPDRLVPGWVVLDDGGLVASGSAGAEAGDSRPEEVALYDVGPDQAELEKAMFGEGEPGVARSEDVGLEAEWLEAAGSEEAGSGCAVVGGVGRAESESARSPVPDIAGPAGPAGKADSVDTAGKADSVDTAGKADSVDTAGSAGAADTADSADSAGTAGPADPVGKEGSGGPAAPAGPADKAGPAAPADPAGPAETAPADKAAPGETDEPADTAGAGAGRGTRGAERMPKRRWPSSTRWRAASAAPPRSSQLTRAVAGSGG
ncbi:hypothetical protein BJY18_006940 [Amycolatopsis jiangsuensis]|uniref:Uncharacterized protein n=1 Tax=Amycolatopsis jiangsuensis TaxID=1181879 RepID=A0A840J777_9PSEU|nr:hypothetical protein [Amycolatopsis jiangsuensis]